MKVQALNFFFLESSPELYRNVLETTKRVAIIDNENKEVDVQNVGQCHNFVTAKY